MKLLGKWYYHEIKYNAIKNFAAEVAINGATAKDSSCNVISKIKARNIYVATVSDRAQCSNPDRVIM
jgi:hypothetical protein